MKKTEKETKNRTLKFRSLNLAQWGFKLSTRPHNARLLANLRCISDSLSEEEDAGIIFLQELTLAKQHKFQKHLEVMFPEHHIIYPVGYRNERNPKAAITVTLIPKKFDHKLLELPVLIDNEPWLRYSYIEISGGGLAKSKSVRILNIHLQHLNLQNHAAWYREARKKQREACLEAIYKVTKENNDAGIPFIIGGDFNTMDDSDDFSKFIELGMLDVMPESEREKDTWDNPTIGAANRLDYFLINDAMKEITEIKEAKVNDDPIHLTTSDHAMLVLDMLVS
ncbi:MAG: endonuclease/exonuclease/phosphatase family protein [Lachnospiraceae bacterium]|nr:endonuclease/exonuclease/phosphatase family protein [Lachnospiraceae bacterium]